MYIKMSERPCSYPGCNEVYDGYHCPQHINRCSRLYHRYKKVCAAVPENLADSLNGLQDDYVTVTRCINARENHHRECFQESDEGHLGILIRCEPNKIKLLVVLPNE